MKFDVKDIQKIKLIIWDLDETFWEGTLSAIDSSVRKIEKNINLVKTLAHRGIISSICSKNNRESAEEKLREFQVLDYFVFRSINWNPKGERIKSIISEMALRPCNVLFIDDNPSNLGEAEFLMPDLMVGDPTVIPIILAMTDQIGKDDSGLSRLNQYKVLEKKFQDAQSYSSNLDFLRSSGIKIFIGNDVSEHLNRIHELIIRSNQLNFTKKRITIEALADLVKDKTVNFGYVKVKDNYGEYGIVGFYAVRNNCLEHFVFSCRTMGMGIEQYVYAMLNYPELEIVPPVSGSVSNTLGKPEYIEQVDDISDTQVEKKDVTILIKGPCDLQVMASYIEALSNDVQTEFNFIDSMGNQADFYNHTVNIINTINVSRQKLFKLSEQFSFISSEAYETGLFQNSYDYICISPLMDATLSVYKRKSDGLLVPFGLYNKPITDPNNWDDYMSKKVMTARNMFTINDLIRFAEEFEVIDYTPEMIANNLEFIINTVVNKNKNTIVVIVLLPELAYNGDSNFEGKEILHKRINDLINERFANNQSVRLLDVNQFIKRQSDYFDNINHYSKLVYYKMAKQLISYMTKDGEIVLSTKPKLIAIFENFKRMFYKKLALHK